MADLSVRPTNDSAQRMSDVVLRATGGYTATLMVPPLQPDSADAGQLGLDAPNLQAVTLSPVSFRRTRAVMSEGQRAKYELVVSASCVLAQVATLALSSADALFAMAASVNVAGLALTVEEWSASVMLGQPACYRVLLRLCEQQTLTVQGG